MAVSISVIIGYHSAGIAGTLAAVLGCILPPMLVMMAVTFFYQSIASNPYVRIFMKGMQAGLCAMLLDVIVSLFTDILKREPFLRVLLIVFCFVCVRYTDLSVFVLLLLCIAVAIVMIRIRERKNCE